MNQYKVTVYKRNQRQQYNSYTVSNGFVSTVEEVFVDADYYIIDDNGVLDFHRYEEYPEHVQSLHGRVKTSCENTIRTFHWNQWLEVTRVEESVVDDGA